LSNAVTLFGRTSYYLGDFCKAVTQFCEGLSNAVTLFGRTSYYLGDFCKAVTQFGLKSYHLGEIWCNQPG
jgi:hypothetical protein